MTAFSHALRSGLAVVAVLAATAGWAETKGGEACTCKNLTGLQQDYQNALYFEAAFRKLSAELKQYEDTDLKNGVSRRDIDSFGDQFYQDAGKLITKGMPFPQVEGYTGPDRVPMPPGTCQQDPALLKELEQKSACGGMADPALLHELEHRQLCESMGAEVYWSRFNSELAAEEADRYKRQAANLQKEIARVLEVSDVRLRGEWMHTLTGEGAVLEFFYTFDSGKISNAQQGDGYWTLKGKGTTSNQMLSMQAEGVTCVSSGAVKNDMEVILDTDGLSFGLKLIETNTGGDFTVDCGFGGAMAIPTGEMSSGQLVAGGQPLRVGDNPVGAAWAKTIKDMAASMGMTVTGEPTTSLSITCEAP